MRLSLLDSVLGPVSFGWAFHNFLRHRLSLEHARSILLRRMAEREENFLHLAERTIFGNSGSPYLPLLKLAGCEMGDLRSMLRAKGLEGTLAALRDAGVYVTFEEFKGSTPIIRNGRTFPVRPEAFTNPLLRRYYEATTGGTTGPATKIRSDLTHAAARAPQMMVAYDAHGVLNVPTALWRGVLPDNSGVSNILRGALVGQVPQRWFVPVTRRDVKPLFRYRLSTLYIIGLGRLHGVPIPLPEPVNLDQADVIACWAGAALAASRACLIRCTVSLAVRVAVAARELGLDLTGAAFMGGGEPPTPAKVGEILRSGARWIPTYAFSESGHVGFGCVHAADGNDIHLFKDSLALVQHARDVPGWDLTVNAFYFTSLLPTAPKILLNAESDDYGTIETRACGCPLEALGFTDHLRHIQSFRKLTSEGMTLAGSDMIRILTETLPARFGGTPLDYQLMEEEDAGGLTRLNLLIHPRVAISDEAAVAEAVLEGLHPRLRVYWKEAGTIRVKRTEPVWTGRGKLMPLNLTPRATREHPN
jgi:hypothetical protein